MSLTGIIWVVLFVVLTALSFRRAVWGVALYIQTFFALPHLWWWGGPLAGFRWNFYAGIILLIVVFKDTAGRLREKTSDEQRSLKWLAFLVINATLVHFMLAEYRLISEEAYFLLLKFSLLVFLMMVAIRTPKDLRIVLWSLTIGVAYIGYEATINDRGTITAGRLENIGAAGATSSNFLASLIVTILPIMGAFIITGSRREKIVAVVCVALSLDTFILCNSRGAFLALILAGAVLVLAARGKARKHALTAIGLGLIAGYFLVGNAKIIDRFMTTFASQDDRDSSAASRLTMWSAALEMVADYPLGAGGEGFKSQHGYKYSRSYGVERKIRAVHNGYINEMCEWGIQGLIIRLLFLASGIIAVFKTIAYQAARGDETSVFFGACLMASMAGFGISSFFGDGLDAEWGYYVVAIMIAFSMFYGPEGKFVDGHSTDDEIGLDDDTAPYENADQAQL